jgi:hypothetical protein
VVSDAEQLAIARSRTPGSLACPSAGGASV